ncbi:hypothetical protein QQG55_56065 [Brugia pahangi]
MKSLLTDDKKPASPMQVSISEGTSNMDISKRNLANNEAELLKEDKKTLAATQTIYSAQAMIPKKKGVQKILPSNVLISYI